MSSASAETDPHAARALIAEGCGSEIGGSPLAALAWPLENLADGLVELGRRAGLAPSAIDPALIPSNIQLGNNLELDRFMRWLAECSGLSAEAVEAPAAGVATVVVESLPAVLQLSGKGERLFLLMLRSKKNRITLLAPDGSLRQCEAAEISDALLSGHEAPLRYEVGHALSILNLGAAEHEASLTAIARARLGTKPIGGVWNIGLSSQASLAKCMRAQGLHWLVASLLLTFAISYLGEICGWTLMGEAILGGKADGWLLAWALLLLSAVPLRFLGARINARLTVAISGIVKMRLMAGALAIDASRLRMAGSGQILAQVMETQAFEALAVNGGLAGIVALIEVGLAGIILSRGAGGTVLVPLLILWLLLISALGYRYHARLAAWSHDRLDLTQDMIARMVGHRTVLAQEPPARRQRNTDLRLKQYHESSKALDGAVMPFLASLPSGWNIAALVGLSPVFITGQATATALAVSIGGILFAGRAINTICGGLSGVARAAVAWRQAAPLFAAAVARVEPSPFISSAAITRGQASGAPVVDAQGLYFSHAGSGHAILNDASFSIRSGDRMLLDGMSGGGKSTLASLLAGLRTPQSGLLLLNGLDRHTLGSAWHRIVTEAPQFHENHIMSAPLAYNLLMGRRWPATKEDLEEAREVCEELGLGSLVERMPAGLMQMVGETGWQLSHGEKSRVYLARALLQKASLTILDESFAALDPETLNRCTACAAKRAKTLLVIAHA